MQSKQAKPCPFCGSTGKLDAQQSYYFMGYKVTVWCPQCGARGGHAISKSDPAADKWQNDACKEAVEKWNQRAKER